MLLNWLMLATLGVMWGGSFTVVGVAVSELPPLTVAAGRLAIGAIALLVIATVSGAGLPRRSERGVWLTALGAALASNAVPFTLLAWGQQHIASGVAGVFMATMPLITLPLAHLFVPGERMSLIRSVGFFIGFVGVMVLIGFDVLAQIGGAGIEVLAQLACLLAATGYAVGSIIAKRGPKAHPISFGAATLILAALAITPVALIHDPLAEIAWSWRNVAAVTWLGLGPTAFAMVVLYLVIQRAGPSFLSLVNYQVPVWAMIFGVLFLDETIPLRAPAALALILCGVALSRLGGARLAGLTSRPR